MTIFSFFILLPDFNILYFVKTFGEDVFITVKVRNFGKQIKLRLENCQQQIIVDTLDCLRRGRIRDGPPFLIPR